MGGNAQRAVLATFASWEIVWCALAEQVSSAQCSGSRSGAFETGSVSFCAVLNIQNIGALCYTVHRWEVLCGSLRSSDCCRVHRSGQWSSCGLW
jgi:hypothetical protein